MVIPYLFTILSVIWPYEFLAPRLPKEQDWQYENSLSIFKHVIGFLCNLQDIWIFILVFSVSKTGITIPSQFHCTLNRQSDTTDVSAT